MDLKALSEKSYEQFIQHAVKNNSVWYLSKDEGSAVCPATGEDDLYVYPFWSEKHLAKGCATKEWKGYEPSKIKLSHFLEVWMIYMYENGHLIGVEWNLDLVGREVHPMEVTLDLIKEIKRHNKEAHVQLEIFGDLTDMEQTARELLEAD